MPHPVIYRGSLTDLLTEGDFGALRPQADGECARLVQLVCPEIGYTGRWQRGDRVMDSPHLLPGTVVANFKLVDGRWKYPNEHGYHTGLFVKWGGTPINGASAEFTIFDQYHGKSPGERSKSVLPESIKKKYAWLNTSSNRADDYYVVLVP